MNVNREALAALRRDRSEPIPTGANRGRWAHWPWWLAGAVVCAAAVAIWRINAAPRVEIVTVEAIERGGSAGAAGAGASGVAVLNASGYVVARRLATVSAKVTGKIEEVLVEEGMSVTRGQVLARLDDRTARAAADLAEAQWRSALKTRDETRVRQAEAQRQRDRFQSLRRDGLVSAAQLDNAESEVSALAARAEALAAEVEVASNGRRLRARDLEDLVVRAPFDGVVTSKDAQPGEMVSPISAGGGFTRTGIATIVDMSSREIEVDVNESFINRVRAGQRTEAILDAYPDWIIPSHVLNIVPTADRQKATVRVRIAFDALDPRILPEMGIKVRFIDEPTGKAAAGAAPAGDANVAAAPSRDAVRVPSSAVGRDGAATIVWVVRDGELERRAVRVADERNGSATIVAGLTANERVVAQPGPQLQDRMRVRVRGD